MSEKIRYEAGQHVLEMAVKDGRWTTTVDGESVARWFESLADAWTAGVTEALRLDLRTAPSLPGGGGEYPRA
jgi:hypothetical protein